MRLAGLTLLALALATAAPAAGTGVQAAAGSFAVDSGRGKVVVQGSGVLVGRLERGEMQIIDLTPLDQWSPRVNGVPRGKVDRYARQGHQLLRPGRSLPRDRAR